MPRATSLLPRLTLLVLALTSGCAFPFFRSRDKSLEEMVTVEAMSEEGPNTPAFEPEPAVAESEKPLPPIARFFGGLFGRGKSKPEADPISTLPAPNNMPSESVAKTTQPKIEFNNTGDVGAGVVAPKPTEATPTAAPQVSNLGEMTPSPMAPEQKLVVKPQPQSQPTEIVNPHAVAQAPPESAASQKSETMPNPSKQTFASQSARSQSGSLTAALRNALDDASKDGLAQQTQGHGSQSIAAKLSSPSRFSAASPTPSQVVDLSSSPIGAKPEASQSQPAQAITNPSAIAEKVIENPPMTSSHIVTAAQKADSNPLREALATKRTRMIDLASQPIGARSEKPQTVYPTQEVQSAPEPVETTTLIAFQSHVHSGDSIIDQMKQSRRVDQFRPMYETEGNTASVTTNRSMTPAPTIETIQPQTGPPIAAAAPAPQAQEALVHPTAPQASPAVIAATPAPAPVPVEIAAPAHPPASQLPTDLAATAPLENPAAANPAMSNPEPVVPPYRPEALSQLVPTEAPIATALLEQPGSQSPVPIAEPAYEAPAPKLAVTPANPVRAVPRVAVAPQSSTASSATPSRPVPQIAARPTPAAVEPMVIPTPQPTTPAVSAVAIPKLAPVVTVEEYRRMQQQRRNQATRQY